ncbi:MAG TPA: hypothetical protein VGI87_03630 [Solirubrobacteraceae bacterium]|jgi:hypothetical protein
MSDSNHATDAVDELVTELLACGGVLSQMMSHMAEFSASGRSAPDAPSIPEVMHTLICSVLDHVERRYSRRDIRMATRLVEEVTTAICDEIYAVNPEMFDDHGALDGAAEAGDPEMN